MQTALESALRNATVVASRIDPSVEVPTGDMPGDKVEITAHHVAIAATALPLLWQRLRPLLLEAETPRAVVAVTGGSGVGKSEVGSLLAHHLRSLGVGTRLVSGDNYPHRIPSANDAERQRVFRSAGLKALAGSPLYDEQVRTALPVLQRDGTDADPDLARRLPWLARYRHAGRHALRGYLGSPEEIDFAGLNAILAAFHAGASTLTLKRMGRAVDQVWYEEVDVASTSVLIVEWTHGNNPHLDGVDVSVLLGSTPEETLAHRRARARDGATDSPFTTMVLHLEQELLLAGAHRSEVIISRAGEPLDLQRYLATMGADVPGAGPMLNAYPDSLGGDLAGLRRVVDDPAVTGAFESVYLLPSLFNSDLDRGFSVIDYGLNALVATPADLDGLAASGLDLKLDFVLNHASTLSPQFQDVLSRGEESPYRDFFIDWNRFWAGHGEVDNEGVIQPYPELLEPMHFRKPGLPLLMVRLPSGREVPYWNTFYQQVSYRRPDTTEVMAATGLQYPSAAVVAARIGATLDAGARPSRLDFTGFESSREAILDLVESGRRYLGQMDLNIASPLVWEFYADTLDRLAGYGARIVRLDAFAYAPKEPGARNFLNDPGTWELLARVKKLADARGLILLPEIHAGYSEGIHEQIAARGFLTYDFFLPGLLLDAIITGDARYLAGWAGEVVAKRIRTVTMLGCHDGVPVLDLDGLLPRHRIDRLIDTLKQRGGLVKDLHGATNVYYQVNTSYFSALGESEEALLLARAIQLFMPGKPQVWYLDLFAGRNDHAAVAAAGEAGHKEINRTNLAAEDLPALLRQPVTLAQLDLLRFRAACPAFGFTAECEVGNEDVSRITFAWQAGGHRARLEADVATLEFTITASSPDGEPAFSYHQEPSSR